MIGSLRLAQLGIALAACLAAIQSEAAALQVRWSATELSAVRRDSLETADAQPQVLRHVIEVVGLFGHDGADTARIRRADIRLVIREPAVAAVARQRALVGIGLVSTTGGCVYVSLPASDGGRLETGLTANDGAGFMYALRTRLLQLARNPSRLCLAFSAPPAAVTRVTLGLGVRTFPMNVEGTR